jgi:hypothetical protein
MPSFLPSLSRIHIFGQMNLRLEGDLIGNRALPLFAFTTFSPVQAPVVIDKIGQVDARVVCMHPSDPIEVLKLIKLGATEDNLETSVGGSISVVGSANYWGYGQ